MNQQDLNNSVSPVNNANSFITGGGLAPANDKGYGTTVRNLDTSYEDRYGPVNVSSSKDLIILRFKIATSPHQDRIQNLT